MHVLNPIRWAKAALEATGWAVWMDESDIASGADWMASIGEGIEQVGQPPL